MRPSAESIARSNCCSWLLLWSNDSFSDPLAAWHGVGLWLHSSCVLLVMLDTQAQFTLADFQQCLESLHLLRVHAINAMPCVL
jgi:hypothetical protein